MTENANDPEATLDDEGTPDAPVRRPVLLGIFGAIALVVAADVLVDLSEGGSLGHLVVEVSVMMAAAAGAALLVRDLLAARARTRALVRELAASHADAARYREESAELLRGLGATIDRQLERWGLTAAEKEVAMLVLKGLSHKEVAEVRGTSERTARKQARAVYAKAGLDGRATLSAFFLEDLLAPAEDAPAR